MIRIAKPSDPQRLAELKKKIHNDDYMHKAINQIANTITKELLGISKE
jgi:hypothetical protein